MQAVVKLEIDFLLEVLLRERNAINNCRDLDTDWRSYLRTVLCDRHRLFPSRSLTIANLTAQTEVF